ncbi:MAG: phosphoribosylglycinamide formyltransferase [Gemmatimonadaceae bacterium]
MPTRIAVLASGDGSNLQAILDHLERGAAARAGEVALVASDRADAGALVRARDRDIGAVAMDRALRSSGLASLLAAHDIELVVLAGYLRFVPADVTRTFRGRILNIHPGLLPAFGGPGMFGHNVHEAVIARGARISGATVHFVDEEYDHGPIVAQWPVPVWPHDTATTLAERVLQVEHQLYPRVVQRVCEGLISLGADGVVREEMPASPSAHFILAGPAGNIATHIHVTVP